MSLSARLADKSGYIYDEEALKRQQMEKDTLAKGDVIRFEEQMSMFR